MIRLRIDPNQHNDDNTTEDPAIAEARDKLFKVKRINNSDLYGDENTQGEHLVLTVAIDPRNNNVGTTTITSVEDAEGNPIKLEQINKGLIMELPEDKIKNFNRKVGIKQEIITKNNRTNQMINYDMLNEPLYGASIDESLTEEVSDFLLNNPNHRQTSRRNYHRIRNYIKIK